MEGYYGDLLDSDGQPKDDPNSLSGAIRRELSEETGTLLAGLMNGIFLTIKQMAGYQNDMVNSLESIDKNTKNNFRLNQMADDISAIKNQLTA
jgi:hypothetical protein